MDIGRKTVGWTATLVLAAATAAAAGGQRQKTPQGGHIVTRTRLVALYTDLETQLATAAQKSDTARLAQLLTDDFEKWTPEPPGDPIPREDWMAAYHPAAFSVSQMSVRAFGDTEIASFLLRQKATYGDKDASGEFFVIDVWRREGNTSRLASRYISRVARTPAPPASSSGKR